MTCGRGRGGRFPPAGIFSFRVGIPSPFDRNLGLSAFRSSERLNPFPHLHGTHTVASRSCICVGQPRALPHLFCTYHIRPDFVLQAVCRSCNIIVT